MPLTVIAAFLGGALCMGLGSLSNGAGIGYVATGALRGWVRQPRFSSSIFRMMLIGQATGSTPSIFALLITLVLVFMKASPDSVPDTGSWPYALAFVGSGLCLGLGSLGSGFGCGIVASEAVEAVARSPRRYGTVFLYMLIGQAWAQTPNIFAFLIGLVLLFSNHGVPTETGLILTDSSKLLAAGICMGAGAIGPALGIGFVGGKFCRALVDEPEHQAPLRNTFFVGAAVAETTAIYALLISLVLLFVVK